MHKPSGNEDYEILPFLKKR